MSPLEISKKSWISARSLRYPIADIIFILLICFAGHWMLLLNDGFFWDDNLLYVLLEGHHYGELTAWMMEMGLPLNVLFFRGFNFFFDVEAHRAVSFASIFLSAIFLNDLFKRFSGGFGEFSLVFTAFYITLFPFRTTVLLSTLHYQVMLLSFVLAVWVRSRYSLSGIAWVRMPALLAFCMLSVFSFGAASILVLFYFYLAFEYFHLHGFTRSAFASKNITIYIRDNFFILILPVAYWGIKSTFFPIHGLYAGYNKISFEPQRFYTTGLYFFLGIFKFGSVYNVATRTPVVFPFLGLLFFSLLVIPRALAWWSFNLPVIGMKKVFLLVWAISFLFITMLPYLLVPTSPRFQGWESRHYLLVTISLPVFVFIALILYLDQLKKVFAVEFVGLIARSIVTCVAFLGVVSSANVYLDLQAIAIKQWATVENLKNNLELKKYSNFWVDDKVGDFSKKEFHWYEATHQNWYEWTAIFTRAWGEPKWYGNNIDESRAYHVKMLRYGAADINPDGDVCYLTLRNVAASEQFVVIRDYWRIKYFGTESQLREYLLSIVYVEPCQPSVE